MREADTADAPREDVNGPTTMRARGGLRRPRVVCVLCLLVPSAAAWAAAAAQSAETRATALFGDGRIEPVPSARRPGIAQALPFQSNASGKVTSIHVYVAARNAAKRLVVGVYANNRGQPGRRIALGSRAHLNAGKWNVVSVRAVGTAAGHTYWLAFLGRGGRLSLRARRGQCRSLISTSAHLRSLPSVWNSSRHTDTCPVSAYAAGIRAGRGVGGGSTAGSGTGTPGGSAGGNGAPPPTAGPCGLTSSAEACWAAHTGVPGYTETQILAGESPLKHVVGDITVTTPGTVISNEWIDGCVAIDADNVTIEDSLIHTQDACNGGNGGSAGSAVNDGNGAAPTGLMIKDTEVDGMNATGDSYGVSGDNYTCLRCNVHGFSKNIGAFDNVVIQDSYSHDLSLNDQCSHSSTVYADSASNVTVEHSFLRATGTSTQCVNSAFMNGGSWNPPSNDTIDSSYLEGVYGADMQEGCGSTGVRVTNNAFSSDNGYGGTDYVYGFDSHDSGNVWAGNYVPELSNEPAPPPRGNVGTGGC